MSSVQKTLLLVVILVIIGGGAFAYFDPLDLDILGLKQKPAAAKPAIPHVASSKAVAPPPMKAPVAAPSPAPSLAHSPAPAATPPVAAPKAAEAPTQANASAAPVATPAAPTPVAAAVQVPQPPMKLSEETKAARKPAPSKPERPKNLDLRHCLELETDAAIAKCAGE